jgi:hypothetical protein
MGIPWIEPYTAYVTKVEGIPYYESTWSNNKTILTQIGTLNYNEEIKVNYEQEIENVHAVYDSWEDVAKTRLMQVEEEYVKKHIVPFVDIKTFTNHIKEFEKNDWFELKSGKLLVID